MVDDGKLVRQRQVNRHPRTECLLLKIDLRNNGRCFQP